MANMQNYGNRDAANAAIVRYNADKNLVDARNNNMLTDYFVWQKMEIHRKHFRYACMTAIFILVVSFIINWVLLALKNDNKDNDFLILLIVSQVIIFLTASGILYVIISKYVESSGTLGRQKENLAKTFQGNYIARQHSANRARSIIKQKIPFGGFNDPSIQAFQSSNPDYDTRQTAMDFQNQSQQMGLGGYANTNPNDPMDFYNANMANPFDNANY